MSVVKALRTISISAAIGITLLGLLLLIPRLFGFTHYAVLSGSMSPEIPVGSVVYVDPSDRDAAVNDIIVYQRDDITIIHRVKEITDEGYVTKGDANLYEDGVVSADRVVGTYRFCIPVIGYFVYPVFHGYAWLIVLVLITLCVLSECFNMYYKKRGGE